MTQTEVRHPRILDPVIIWGERGTIVALQPSIFTALGSAPGVAVIDSDDLRVTCDVSRLRWDSILGAWAILRDEPGEPKWLHEDPAFADHPADATVEGEYAR